MSAVKPPHEPWLDDQLRPEAEESTRLEPGRAYNCLSQKLGLTTVEDTCRICTAPAEEGMPLYHPCKCSGTIRFVHHEWYVRLNNWHFLRIANQDG